MVAEFNRLDICLAHQALENDFNVGGWLHERPSNIRRNEATHVQLHRMKFQAGVGEGGTFDALEDNAKEIYVNAIVNFGLARYVTSDEGDTLSEWIKTNFVSEFVQEYFPHLL